MVAVGQAPEDILQPIHQRFRLFLGLLPARDTYQSEEFLKI
jgi:hypothetical protein